MGTTAQKLQAIQNSKAAIKSAIEAKGVSDVGDVLADYATKIGQISGGGSSGDPRYEVSEQGALSKKSFAVNWFNDLTSIPDNGLEYAYYGSNVTSASFPNVTSVGSSGLANTFRGCTSLTSVSFPNLTSVGNYGMSYTFDGCSSLTSVDLSNVTSVGHQGMMNIFYNCNNLRTVDLSGLTRINSNEALRNAFYRCPNLTDIDLSNLTQVGNSGLIQSCLSCTSLTSIDLSNVTSVGDYGLQNMFYNCTNLRNVFLKKLSSAATSAFYQIFYNCTNLELVDFSEATSVPSLTSTNAFSNTNNYFRIVVPNALYNQWITATNWSNPSIVTHIEKAIKALSFKAGSANSTISLDAVGTPTSIDIEYSTDNGATFSPYTVGTTITLTSVGDNVLFRAGTTGNTAFADDSSNYHKFVMSGSITLEDDVSYLLNKNAVPATTALADYAFYGLFKGCASLQNAPELPWTTMGEGCYGHMFEGCTALTDAPDLPSTSLDDYCYEGMFKGCTSITSAPKLSATTLATGCYNEMFYGCSALNSIYLAYDGNFSTTYFNDWVYGVAASGTITYDGTDTTTGASALPSGWTVQEIQYEGLNFIAKQTGSTVMLSSVSGAPTVSLQYSLNKGKTWNSYTRGDTITVANVGDRVCFKATTTNATMSNSYNGSYNYFVMTGQFDASGNINSLLNEDFDAVTTAPQYAFVRLFTGNTSIIDASQLKLASTATSSNSYGHLFDGCSNLTNGPDICATTLGNYSLEYMFNNCSSLNEIKLRFTGTWNTGVFQNWVSGVQTTSGTFYYNGYYTTRGNSNIPANWTITTFST